MKIIAIILSTFLTIVNIVAQEDTFRKVNNKDEVVSLLNHEAKNLQTIQSDFTQTKHMDFMKIAVLSQGKFWFKKENKLRWEYTNPYSCAIIVNNGNINIIEGENSSEFKVKGNKIFQQINSIIVASIQGNLVNDERFDVDLLENSDYFKVVLFPKQKDIANIIKEMHIFIDKVSVSLSKIKMVEANNDYSLIEFNNKKINVPIPSEIFGLQ